MITGIRRSSLYVPADSLRMIRKSTGLSADMLLINLEDGVALSRKNEARSNAVEALKTIDFGRREVVVRINDPTSEVGKRDLAAIVPLRPDGICLPKVESAEAIHLVDEAVLEIEIAGRLPENRIFFHAMIESARGVLKSAEIAGASLRMSSLIFGSADFVKDMRSRPGRDRAELSMALQQMVLACRAAGIDAIDSPCFDLRDPEALRAECSQAYRMGYDGKNALHPDQLAAINELFSISPEDLAWARRVLEELEEADQRGSALSTLDGRLIDNPHRTAAERILRKAALCKENEAR